MISRKIGAGCLSTKPDVFRTRIRMIDQGLIGHVQLMIIPESEQTFQEHLNLYETMNGFIRIHAPHHSQQVNPCAPELFSAGIRCPVSDHIENMMQQTFEAADRTGSPVIILHAGRFLPGHKDEAIEEFQHFLDLYPDRRYALESLCDLTVGLPYLGTTPEDLHLLGADRIKGYCLDFPHLFCTGRSHHLPYQDLLREMDSLPLLFSHLSGTPGPDTDHQHLFMDDPENCLDHQEVSRFITSHPELEISLEFAIDDPDQIRDQISWCNLHL